MSDVNLVLQAVRELQNILCLDPERPVLDFSKLELVKSFVADILELIDPSLPYGSRLFDALSRITVSVAIEACPVRINNKTGQTEVFLCKRSLEDTTYPGEWHFPGSVIRPREEIDDVFKRLERKEFGVPVLEYKAIGFSNHAAEGRGHFFCLVHLVQIAEIEQTDTKKWFPVSDLPSPIVKVHLEKFIPMAVEVFSR